MEVEIGGMEGGKEVDRVREGGGSGEELGMVGSREEVGAGGDVMREQCEGSGGDVVRGQGGGAEGSSEDLVREKDILELLERYSQQLVQIVQEKTLQLPTN